MKTIYLWDNNLQIEEYITKKEKYLIKEWFKSEIKFILTKKELNLIQKATKEEDNLESHNNRIYIENAHNWIIFLTKWSKIIGFIFNFSYKFKEQDIFERGTLWIDPEFRQYGFWKYLMFKMTKYLNWKPIVSVTSNSIVQKINEVLMEYEIIEPEWDFRKSLEENWPLNSKYRYFISNKIAKLIK